MYNITIMGIKSKRKKTEIELKKNSKLVEDSDFEELTEVLVNLGYKTNDIKKILPNISQNDTIENQVKEALKLMLK